MNKYQWSFTLIFIIMSMGFSYYKITPKNDLEVLNLKGNVKSIKELTYLAESNTQELVKIKLAHPAYSSNKDQQYIFNQYGNFTSHLKWTSEGDTLEKYYKTYNQDNLLVKRTSYTRKNALEWYEKYTLTHFYNNKKQRTHTIDYGNNDQFKSYDIFEYNDKGHNILIKNYGADSVLNKKYRTLFKNNMKEEIWSDACDKVDFYHQVFYNEDSVKIRAKAYFFHNDTFPDTTYYNVN